VHVTSKFGKIDTLNSEKSLGRHHPVFFDCGFALLRITLSNIAVLADAIELYPTSYTLSLRANKQCSIL